MPTITARLNGMCFSGNAASTHCSALSRSEVLVKCPNARYARSRPLRSVCQTIPRFTSLIASPERRSAPVLAQLKWDVSAAPLQYLQYDLPYYNLALGSYPPYQDSRPITT